MSKTQPRGRQAPSRLDPGEQARLRRLDHLAELLDASIRIPGIGYRIGYDALIGLLPGIGDVAGLLVGTYIVLEAARFRIPRSTLLRMVANVAIDAAVGAVPGLGDLFDATYKSNLRNLDLLHRRLELPGGEARSDRRFFGTVVAVPILVAVLLLAAIVALLIALF